VARKLLAGALAVGLVISSCWIETADAASNNPESKLKEIQQDKEKAEQDLNKTQSTLGEKKKKVDELEKQVGQLNDQIAEHQKRLMENQKLLKKQEEQFESVVVRMYQKGRIHYVSTLLSADSFSEFLARFEMLRIWVKQEKAILDGYAETKQNIEKEISAINQKKSELNPVLTKAKSELGQYTKLYNQHKTTLNKLKHEEEVTKEAIERKNQLVRSANAGGSYGSGQLAWPQPGGRFTSGFGWRNGRMHEGIDIANSIGSPIVAADSGVVVLTKSDPDGYGYYVVIDHGDGLKTLYAHMYPSTVRVSVGQRVSKGQRIASVGNNGRSSGPHLHFETHKNGTPVNPMRYY